MNVMQIQSMFATRPLTPDQAERLQAVRQAAAGFAMVILQATVESPVRVLAINAIRESFAMTEHAISLEQQGGKDSGIARIKFFNQIRSKMTPGEGAKLAAMLGMLELVEEPEEKK